MSLDKAVEYSTKLQKFADTVTTQSTSGRKMAIEIGRKFDKVFINSGGTRRGLYMVDRNSWTIFGIKSWAQHNPRRTYGTLDTIDQYDWSILGVPKAGTDAEKAHAQRETEIANNYARRGRPKKIV